MVKTKLFYTSVYPSQQADEQFNDWMEKNGAGISIRNVIFKMKNLNENAILLVYEEDDSLTEYPPW